MRTETGQERFNRLAAEGHRIAHHWTEYMPDSMEGYLTCECGWRTRSMKSCWWNDHIDAHLSVVGRG